MVNFSNIVGGGGNSASSSQQEEASYCGSLTYSQRVIGFCVCFGLGYFLSFLSTLSLLKMSAEGLREFASLYVLGNLVAIGSTLFLIGPKRHCKKMFHKTRRWAAIIYLTMLVAVFVSALLGAHIAVVLFLLLIQVLAAIWYTASYIPYGRKMIVNCLQTTCFRPCKDSLNSLAT
ncbi:unnamed protein product [Heterosigma akashiwo]|mmetsp:Transcript_2011/g.2715  ORF Transcript_2011/g.2715 Transcript_2011/m.2715 type:complete len:175 (-) Transcript_2011:113-637(-)